MPSSHSSFSAISSWAIKRTWSWSWATADGPDSRTVTIPATDSDGAFSQISFTLTVNNVAPEVTVQNITVTVSEGQTATNGGAYGDPRALKSALDRNGLTMPTGHFDISMLENERRKVVAKFHLRPVTAPILDSAYHDGLARAIAAGMSSPRCGDRARLTSPGAASAGKSFQSILLIFRGDER